MPKKAIYIFKNVNYLFWVSDEHFGVSVDNIGVSGMVAAGVSGTTPMMLLSSYTPQDLNLLMILNQYFLDIPV